ncbi:putative soluble epoxide hydrolase [Helianthus anomalus]
MLNSVNITKRIEVWKIAFNFCFFNELKYGPIILFLHGFPELWYSWCHQIHALAALGYHCVAPDLRGYGDTDASPSATSYTCLHVVVGDVVALIDSLGGEAVYLVAHDWGAIIGWYLCLFRPDKVKAYACMSMPYRPRNQKMKPVETMRALFGEEYYMCRFQVCCLLQS